MKQNRIRPVWSAFLAMLLCCAMLCASCGERSDTPNLPTESDTDPSFAPSAGEDTGAAPTPTPGANGTSDTAGKPTGDFVKDDAFDGGTPSVQGWEEYETYLLTQHSDKFHMQGRTQALSTGMSADWAASGFEFCADFQNTVYVVATANQACQFAVFVNGAQTGVLTLRIGETIQYPLPVPASGEGTVIRLTRMTRPVNALVSFASVMLDGEVKTWSAAERKLIEFVGDSITCGCGLVSPSLADYDASKTFAYQTANALGCDYSMVSEGGIGVSASNSWHNGNTIGTLYGCTGFYRDSSVLYTPDRTADLVVVNLNTNDHGNLPAEAAYKEDARALIVQIRAMHGHDVKIVWIVGHMIDSTASVNLWLSEVFAELGGTANGLYTLTVTKDNAGGASHPSVESHAAVAQALQAYIETNNLLG